MFNRSRLAAASNTTDRAADHLANAADQGIEKARAVALDALDQLQAALDSAERRGQPVVRRFAGRAEEVAQRGAAAVRQGSQQAREFACQSAEQATDYARRNPYKTALFAALAVASIAAVAGALSLSKRTDA